MQLIKGLIFDFDGLILDTESAEYEAWQEIYSDYGAELSIEDWAVCLGTSSHAFDAVSHLFNQTGIRVNNDEIRRDQKSRAIARINTTTPLPGVVAMIEHAWMIGLLLGIASSSPRNWVEGHLQRLSLDKYFKVIVCKEDVEQVKPAPDLYQLALKRLELTPNETIAFEDSPYGIQAAHSAGIFCVGVPNIISRQLDISQADLIVPSLACHTPTNFLTSIQKSMYGNTRSGIG